MAQRAEAAQDDATSAAQVAAEAALKLAKEKAKVAEKQKQAAIGKAFRAKEAVAEAIPTITLLHLPAYLLTSGSSHYVSKTMPGHYPNHDSVHGLATLMLRISPMCRSKRIRNHIVNPNTDDPYRQRSKRTK